MDEAEAVAGTVLAALGAAAEVVPFSKSRPGFSSEEAYAVTAALRRLRVKRGEKPVGRKIGFTNRGIWEEYGVFEPIWGDIYDSTCFDVASGSPVRISHLPEPRIEPEIVLGLNDDLRPGMTGDEILERIGWVAHGFEIVQSIFPGWRFEAADCIADGGLHGALLIGERRRLESDADRETFRKALTSFAITISRNGEPMDSGTGANVLDGPLSALAHLVDVLARDRFNPPLRAGELVTTGTLTRAFPIAAGEEWSTRLEGVPLSGLRVRAE